MSITTNIHSILDQIDQVNPIRYGQTRNFIDGAVTKLSPYISRGVINLRLVKEAVLKKYSRRQAEKFLQELAWREYLQRVWEARADEVFTDLKQPQLGIETKEIPLAIINGTTGIIAIDSSIQQLYNSGYMHNHCRMYVASITCNIAKAHWREPSRWLYYHLLDGDLASNSLSWQWVAGSFSSKKYYCNQENINKYCYTNQRDTFLDQTYDDLTRMELPQVLKPVLAFNLGSDLPVKLTPSINEQYPTLIYNAYNLDPFWHTGEKANRILLLEPSFYQRYPVSKKVIQFITALTENIPGIQIFSGEFSELQALTGQSRLIFKKHPGFPHYTGQIEYYDYLFPQVSGYYNSFFSYWKKCERYI